MSTESPEAFRKHIRGYIAVFVALMALTAITVWTASWKLSVPLGIALALAIACTKGTLVAAFFMHLKDEKPLIFYCVALTAFLLLAVLLLPLAGTLLSMRHNAG